MTVSVMREPAMGAMVLHRMLFFLPSRQIVLLNPQIASLAASRFPEVRARQHVRKADA